MPFDPNSAYNIVGTDAGKILYEQGGSLYSSTPPYAVVSSVPDGIEYSALTALEIQSIRTSVPGDGSKFALSEVQPVVTLTASGSGKSGAGYYAGIKVQALSGTPQTITVYDNTSASGTVIDTIVISSTAVATYFWNRIDDTPTGGSASRRPFSTGCYVSISGGTSRTLDVMVE